MSASEARVRACGIRIEEDDLLDARTEESDAMRPDPGSRRRRTLAGRARRRRETMRHRSPAGSAPRPGADRSRGRAAGSATRGARIPTRSRNAARARAGRFAESPACRGKDTLSGGRRIPDLEYRVVTIPRRMANDESLDRRAARMPVLRRAPVGRKPATRRRARTSSRGFSRCACGEVPGRRRHPDLSARGARRRHAADEGCPFEHRPSESAPAPRPRPRRARRGRALLPLLVPPGPL